MPYASGLGASLGFGVEGTPGTEAVPTAWYEFLSESLTLNPTYIDSAGAEYLMKTLNQPAFPDLWAIRSEL